MSKTLMEYDFQRGKPQPTTLLVSIVVTCALFLGLALEACNAPQKPLSETQTLKRGLSGEPASLDPAAAADTFSTQLIRDLYEGLTAEASDGSIVPAAAVSWSTNTTGTKYTFKLRPEARWSNGERLRAQDFVNSWRRVVDPTKDSPVADNLRLIAGASLIIAGRASPETLGVKAIDDGTLVIDLEGPTVYLPQLLANTAAFPVYSEKSARAHGASGWVSNGPFVLAAWQPGTTASLVKSTQYWDKSNVHVTSVEYQFAPNENSQYDRYRAGSLDITDSVPANVLPKLQATHPSEIIVAPFLATAYYGFNVTSKLFGHNILLRKALAMAIDRRQIVDAQGFGQVPAYGFVPPGTWNYSIQPWAWEGLSKDQRVAEARRLYTAAGYSINVPLRLRLLYNTNVGIKNTAILIAAMWKDTLGIHTELTEEEYRVFLESRHDRTRWDIVRLGWTADFNDASNFLDVLRSGSANNDMNYSNHEVDALLDEAASALNIQRRRELLQSAERRAMDEYPIIPLYYFVSKRLVKPYVTGVKPTSLDHVPTKTMAIISH